MVWNRWTDPTQWAEIVCQKEAVQSFDRETKHVVVFVSRHQEGSRGIIYSLRRPVGRRGATCVFALLHRPQRSTFLSTFLSLTLVPHNRMETLVRQATYGSHLFAAQERLSSLANKNIHYLTYIYLKEVFVWSVSKKYPRKLETGTLLKDHDANIMHQT